MHNVNEYQEVITKRTHNFQCDNCNKFLGSSEEYDDGYYETFGNRTIAINLDKKKLEFKACLCDECYNEFIRQFKNNIKPILNYFNFNISE